MRKCFTKITNLFRKIPPESVTTTEEERLSKRQNEEGYDKEDFYICRDTTALTTTEATATVRTSGCDQYISNHSGSGENDKELKIKNISDTSTSNKHDCIGYARKGLEGDEAEPYNQQTATHGNIKPFWFHPLKSYRKKLNKPIESYKADVAGDLGQQDEVTTAEVNNLETGQRHTTQTAVAATSNLITRIAEREQSDPLTTGTDPEHNESEPTTNFNIGVRHEYREEVVRLEDSNFGVFHNKHNSDVQSPLSSTNADLIITRSCNEIVAAAKTPEEIEYDAKVAAECEDVMTPLPNVKHNPLALGRSIQPELLEVIRNLDANSLLINNLTIEDKVELMRRFEDKLQLRSHRRGNSQDSPSTFVKVLHTDTSDSHHDEQQEDLSDSGIDDVVLRRKGPYPFQCEPAASGLYERRQPRSPKLKLMLENNKKETSLQEIQINTTSYKLCCSKNEKNLYDVKCPTVLPPNPQLKALLVFHKIDNIYEVVQQACNRQQVEVTLVRAMDSALENLCSTTECYHIIIIDARSPKHVDAEHIARSIRHMSGHHFTTIIAVVKKSIFDRDDVINALLDAGVNRCIAESTSLSMCSMELKQILHSIVRPHNVISTQQALYTALHRLKEVLIITDDLLRIQYANKSAERLLNMRLDEVINKPLADIFISDVSSINSSTQGKGVREFDGILTVRRKNQEGIPMHVRVVPVACIGRTPTHFVFNFDVPGGHTDFIATLPQPKEAPRGSLHSIRRGSFDVRSIASDGLRRTSLAKLTSLPLEAPITKIINLLSQVQENCSADEARLIDKVMEFLKREGLYSPQMKEIRPDDPIATDLIGALLTGPNVFSSRRSSNDSIVRTNCSNRQSTVMPAKMKATPLIMEILEESLNWEFNIFKLEEVTEKHPLLYLGMEIFRRFDVFATLNVDEAVCKNWLAVIERNYHADNSYHNSTHAADVMQATGVFITQLAAKDLVMDSLEEAAALIAAAAHDVDHPGRSSAFLCNSNSPLAILYNDLTVLESHHASTTFRLTLGDDNANIFKNLDTETYKLARTTIIDMILATEMTRHFEHLAKFVSVFGAEVEPRDIVQSEDESSVLMRRMLIKVADVSNPARPMICCIEWSRRIAEEYFMQTDEEKTKSLPIVMPMFDRGTCSIPKSQIGFIEYIIQDMMHAWDSFIDMPELITYMQINYAQWKKFEDQGIHTLAEVKAKQMSLMSKKSALK